MGATDNGPGAWIPPLLVLVAFCAFPFIGCGGEINDPSAYVVVGQGTYERAEYTGSGTTIIYFTDGHTCVLNGHYSVPMAHNKAIKILGHRGTWPYKFEELK